MIGHHNNLIFLFKLIRNIKKMITKQLQDI